MVNSNVTTLTLDGNEISVEFADGYPYIFIRNDGNEAIYVSMSPNIIPKAEGVYTILPGGEERIGAGYSLTKFYILGSGEAYIRGEEIAAQPSFKKGGKGGDGNAEINILPHSEGLTYYFDYQKNITATGWKDIVQGYRINADVIYNDEYATLENITRLNWNMKNTFTAYCVCKCQNTSNDYKLILGLSNDDLTKWACMAVGNNNVSAFIDSLNNKNFLSDNSASNYSVCAFTLFEDKLSYYINGNKVYTSSQKNFLNSFNSWLLAGTSTDFEPYYKAMAFYENVAQGSDVVMENTQYLVQKYGLQI